MASCRLTVKRTQVVYTGGQQRRRENHMPDATRNRRSKNSIRALQILRSRFAKEPVNCTNIAAGLDGHDLDDWLTAESEVTGRRRVMAG